jgi:hypothetical protein
MQLLQERDCSVNGDICADDCRALMVLSEFFGFPGFLFFIFPGFFSGITCTLVFVLSLFCYSLLGYFALVGSGIAFLGYSLYVHRM